MLAQRSTHKDKSGGERTGPVVASTMSSERTRRIRCIRKSCGAGRKNLQWKRVGDGESSIGRPDGTNFLRHQR